MLFGIMLLTVVAVLLLAIPPLFLLSQNRREAVGRAISRTFFGAVRVVYGIDVRVKGCPPEHPVVILANHHSHLDIVALSSVFPTSFLGKADILDWPLVGTGAKLCGYLFVRRGDRSSGEAAVDAILSQVEAGGRVVTFPEGTTTDQPVPQPFKPGFFKAVAGQSLTLSPVRIVYTNPVAYWVGDEDLISHLLRLGEVPKVAVELNFLKPIECAEETDGIRLRELAEKRFHDDAEWAEVRDVRWLSKPWKKQWTTGGKGDFRFEVHDQPGRWMSAFQLNQLHQDLLHVGINGMGEPPDYGIFLGEREMYRNRIICVAYHQETNEPAAFTAMVYLPFHSERGMGPLIHLGLTVIGTSFRGMRLQTSLFKRVMSLALLNLQTIEAAITNIAASPAGIGATSDYFLDVYPTYRGDTLRTKYHVAVARQILANHRHEFGCSSNARFNEETFVVHGSNEPSGGGAFQFIKTDPVSHYKREECNTYCASLLNFEEGDELFQVGKVNVILGLFRARSSRKNKVSRHGTTARGTS